MIGSIQISVLILGVSSSLVGKQGKVKVINTEKLVVSLGNIEDEENSDLEMIRSESHKSDKLNKELKNFHNIVRILQIPQARQKKVSLFGGEPAMEYSISYPDSPYEVSANRKELMRLLRRQNKQKTLLEGQDDLLNFVKGGDILEKKAVKSDWGTGHKMQTTDAPVETETEYDYLAKDYHELVANANKTNKMFKYTDEGKPEESFKEIIDKIADVKPPKNCTNVTGIGIQAMECLVKEIQNKEITPKKFFTQVSIILLIWLAAYLIIVLPLWCTKGWCCCCFRCSFCLPYDTVKDIQKYIAENPPGVYVNSEGEKVEYRPNARETELFENLKKSIANF